MADIDLQREDDPDGLRQVAILLEAEVDELHEWNGAMSADIQKLREQTQGRQPPGAATRELSESRPTSSGPVVTKRSI